MGNSDSGSKYSFKMSTSSKKKKNSLKKEKLKIDDIFNDSSMNQNLLTTKENRASMYSNNSSLD